MFEILFSTVIVLVLFVTWRRKRSARQSKDSWSEEPGRSPSTAIIVDRFDEMDRLVRMTRCHCGGRTSVVSEGSKTFDGQRIKVIRADCDECEDELYFFFRTERTLH